MFCWNHEEKEEEEVASIDMIHLWLLLLNDLCL